MALVRVGSWPIAPLPPIIADLTPEARRSLHDLIARNTGGPYPVWRLLAMTRVEPKTIVLAVQWQRWMGSTPYGLVALGLGESSQVTLRMTYHCTERAVREALAALHRPASGGMTVTLEALPNADFRFGSHEATVHFPAREVSVGNVAEAREVVRLFIEQYDLGGGNFTGLAGVVRQDGKPVCRISYNLRVWQVDAEGRETGEALVGDVAP